MTKIITCPECGEPDKPVRDDALVCSNRCRVRKSRRLKKENESLTNKSKEGSNAPIHADAVSHSASHK